MRNGTKYVQARVKDIRDLVFEATIKSGGVDIFLDTIENTMGRTMDKLDRLENDCRRFTQRKLEAIKRDCSISTITGVDCVEIYTKGGRKSGLYYIRPIETRPPVKVC